MARQEQSTNTERQLHRISHVLRCGLGETQPTMFSLMVGEVVALVPAHVELIELIDIGAIVLGHDRQRTTNWLAGLEFRCLE